LNWSSKWAIFGKQNWRCGCGLVNAALQILGINPG
jgi:hypothetical protein